MELCKVDIYISTRIKGLRAEYGYYSYVVEFTRKDGNIITREGTAEEGNATRNVLELAALYGALQILKKPCRVKVHTQSWYLVQALNCRWAERWEKDEWKNSRGDPVKNADIWMEVWSLAGEHEIEAEYCRKHPYTYIQGKWMEQEQKTAGRAGNMERDNISV